MTSDTHVFEAAMRSHAQATGRLEPLLPTLSAVAQLVCASFGAGGRLYAFGNGGSAADAQHLVGELVGRFQRTRRALPAVCLATDPVVLTCIGNDYSHADLFSRQVQALARPGDVVVAFSSSGRSPNVVAGLRAGQAAGATTVLFGAGDGGPAAAHAHHGVLVPDVDTPRAQEMHLLLLHMLSDTVDRWAEQTETGERGTGPPDEDRTAP